MDAFVFVLIVIAGLLILNGLTAAFGVDSRDGMTDDWAR
jgi:hypothetical protein